MNTQSFESGLSFWSQIEKEQGDRPSCDTPGFWCLRHRLLIWDPTLSSFFWWGLNYGPLVPVLYVMGKQGFQI